MEQNQMLDPIYVGKIFGCKFIDLSNINITTDTLLMNMVRNNNYKIRVEVPKALKDVTQVLQSVMLKAVTGNYDMSGQEIATALKTLFNEHLHKLYPNNPNNIKILYREGNYELDNADIIKNIMEANGCL